MKKNCVIKFATSAPIAFTKSQFLFHYSDRSQYQHFLGTNVCSSDMEEANSIFTFLLF